MRLIDRSLGYPLLEKLLGRVRQYRFGMRRRHHLVLLIAQDATNHFARLGLPGHDYRFS
jgi:hypothetical protein